MALTIKENCKLDAYTTFQVGGVARYVVEIKTKQELSEAVEFIKQTNLPHLFLGGGSNMLVADEGFSGVVLQNLLKGTEYREESDGGVTLVCQSGEVLDVVVEETVSLGYWGIENLSGIPGTIGATPVQNVGAYGVEVSDVISAVEVFDFVTQTHKIFSNEECKFLYRDSFFKTEQGKNYFITAVHLKLKKEIAPNIEYADLKKIFGDTLPTQSEIRNALLSVRSKKFPDWKVIGTAGSFFKNPIISKVEAKLLLEKFPELPQYEVGPDSVKIPLGYVLDKLCGLKGYREGRVGLFSEQALVVVNFGGASAEEIKNFTQHIAEKVFEKTNITILPEVQFIQNK